MHLELSLLCKLTETPLELVIDKNSLEKNQEPHNSATAQKVPPINKQAKYLYMDIDMCGCGVGGTILA